jgi:hypothetical protein
MNSNTLFIEDASLFEKYDPQLRANIREYLSQLNPIERKAYKIAKDHLGTSFNLIKSNGFCDWLKDKK